MNSAFAHFVNDLEPKFQALMMMTPARYGVLPAQMPERGIYLFSDGDQHLYVGRTNGIRRRLAGHCRPSSTHFSATFAFRMARVQTGLVKASYTTKGSRADLIKNEEFRSCFESAKGRLRKLDLRFVQETEAVRQVLLEVYVAVVLKTPFNDFDNH